jgi:Protein of unknown function (DUF3800)
MPHKPSRILFGSHLYLCYIDESGTPDVPGNTSHFVLAGVTLPVWHWKDADREVSQIMARHGVPGQELHTAWLLRPYVEQELIPAFENMTFAARRSAVERERNAQLLKLQRRKGSHAAFRQARKNYQKSAAYIHLTRTQRLHLAEDIADAVGNWGFARLFAECIGKLHHDPVRHTRSIEEQALEQVISRVRTH